MKISIRTAEKKDISFITATWMRALWHSGMYKHIKKSIFMTEHHDAIQKRMRALECVVACNPDDPYVIYGYLVFSRPNVIHFAYTKGSFRNMGISRELIRKSIESDEIIYTHQTDYSREIAKDKQITFNPYKFYEVLHG